MYLRIIPLVRGRRARWALTAAVLLLALLTLVWFTPAMVGSRIVWPRAVAYLVGDLDATVTTSGVTLQWLRPVVLHDVRVADAAGEPVVSIGAIRTEKSLFSLLWRGGDFGKLVIDQPELQLRLRTDGSNLEDTLTAYLARSGSSARVTGTIEITDGAIVVATVGDENAAPVRFDAIAATVTLAGGVAPRGAVKLQSCRAATGVHEGTLAGTLTWCPAVERPAVSQRNGASTDWSVTANARSFDLSLLQGVAKRFAPAVDLKGIADGQVTASWQSAADGMEIAMERLTVRQFQLKAPDYLGADVLAFEQLEGQGACQVAGDNWQMMSVKVACDVGQITLDAKLRWPASAEADTMRRLADLATTADLAVAGHVDLAQLAATLPHTLHVREGAVIESGTMNFTLQGGEQSGGRQWKAWMETSALSGRRARRQFSWKTPLQVIVEVNQVGNDWQVKQLDCQSSFLSLSGSGTPRAGSFTLQCDLQQLMDQLQEFVELGSLQAAGTMSARLDWKQGEDGRVTIQGTSLIENLDLASQATGRWREPRLAVTLTAAGESGVGGETGDQRVLRIHTAQLELASRNDQLGLQLLEPVESPGPGALWVVGCHASGRWETWFARLRPLMSPRILSEGIAIVGPLDVQLTARISPHGLEIEQGTLASEPFLLDLPGMRIHERAIALELEGEWDFAARRLCLPDATFQSETIAFRISDLRVDRADDGLRTTGDVTFRADLDKFHNAWYLPGKQNDWKIAGSVQGQVSLVQLPDATQARWTVDLVGLELEHRQGPRGNNRQWPNSGSARTAGAGGVIPAAASPASAGAKWATVWREPTLKITGLGQYALASETIRLDRFDLKSADKLQLSLQGSLRQPIGLCAVDLQGQVTYDLAKLLRQWAPELQKQVQWTGHDTQSFQLRGPLFQRPADRRDSTANPQADAPAADMIPLTLYGESGVSWQSADIFGISVGPGDLTATLEKGLIRTGIVELPISGGTMRIEPTVRLNDVPPVISITPGQVLTNVQITAGMCDQWLKYIAPIAAEATEAKGQFSLTLASASIPLDQPVATHVAGALEIHAASIGPGPLARQLIAVANRVKSILQLQLGDLGTLGENPWVQLPQQKTQFQVIDQRVHHERLSFVAGGVSIHTRGSVGFDQSLSLVAQIPIRDAWIASNPRLAVLRGYVVQIPIGGTLSNPQIDQRALERLAADALRAATSRVIEDEVKKGLQRWLGSER